MTPYDVVVIGAGAGGGVAASVLALNGVRVLLLEEGDSVSLSSTGRDHLRNHRVAKYGLNTRSSAYRTTREVVDPDGNVALVWPEDPRFQLNASSVGGGAPVYGAQAWRFHPIDFQMAREYGSPPDSGLVDWPFGYEELEPFYERVEHEVGVAGDAPSPVMPNRRPYPMLPTPLPEKSRRLAEAAGQLRWDVQRVPLLVNSEPREGREACVHCQHCVGFACPTDAKNGPQNTLLPRALATGNLTLLTQSVVSRIELTGTQATGVRLFHGGKETQVTAGRIIVAAGAIESARLLLASGLQNDALGRYLQGHYYAGAHGIFPDPVWDGIGPGPGVATLRFTHDNDDFIGGAMLADDFIPTPIAFAKYPRPSGVPGYGQAFKDWMRYAYRRYVSAVGPVHEIPSSLSRVTIDSQREDDFGRPLVRLSGTTHPETVRTAMGINQKAAEWLAVAGCERVWTVPHSLRLSAGQHQAGTCRMGDDRRSSVVDRFGKVHGIDNLYVADGSVHPTNGSFNPVLTIMALAYRMAEAIAKS